MKVSLLIITALAWLPAARGQGTLDLSRLAGWTIVVADGAIPSEHYAAREFQSLFQQAFGIRLPLDSRAPKATRNVFIGSSPDMRSSSAACRTDDLGEEGLRIRITPGNIAIAGGEPRGTLYGVYEFMERYLGVRFLTYDHTYVPQAGPRPVPYETREVIPPFSFRWSYYKENADHPEFAARLRVNTVTHDEKLGGVTPQRLISHSLYRLLPVAQYGKEHPEYFALVDGERKLEMGGGGPELCVSNPEVIEIVAQNVIKELDRHPDWKNISVSQNDNAAYCRCERCEAINQREGTPMGAHLAFVNAVAERVEKVHPGVKIGTLAYWYTRKPPRTIRPRANVQIQLCSIECSTLYPIEDPSCEKNRSFRQDMNAWSKICDDIWMWNYNTNFHYYDLPFPNLHAIGSNIRYFLRHHVKGLFMQANGNGGTGELCDLRNYVISRCMWHPELDSWELAKEFCRLHYGRAAETIIEYLTYLHDNAVQAGFEPGCFPRPFDVGIHPDSADRIFDYFQKAMSQAENETVRNRVEKASICAYRAVLETTGRLAVRDGLLRVEFPGKYGDVVNDYIALTKKHGETRAEESHPIEDYYRRLRKATQEGYTARTLENSVWRLTIVAEENGKMVALLHKPSGRHLFMPPAYRSLRHLFESMTFSEVGAQGYDANRPREFQIKRNGSRLTLTKRLAGGSIIRRRIWVEEAHPEILRFQTTITHQGPAPKTYQIRVRPEFHTGDESQDKAILSGYIRNGRWKVLDEKEGVAAARPAGSTREESTGTGFAFYHHRDRFGLLLAYDAGSMQRLRFKRDGREPKATVDLLTRPVSLRQGESFSFEYQMIYLEEPPKSKGVLERILKQ